MEQSTFQGKFQIKIFKRKFLEKRVDRTLRDSSYVWSNIVQLTLSAYF